jgi:hypothetical protein
MKSIMQLEEIIHTKWVYRALILCENEQQCSGANYLLSSLDYMVETILPDDMTEERSNYYSSILRLRKGLSKVLVTTPEVLSAIQKDMDTQLHFDVVL